MVLNAEESLIQRNLRRNKLRAYLKNVLPFFTQRGKNGGN
jgi:hypothetical protein